MLKNDGLIRKILTNSVKIAVLCLGLTNIQDELQMFQKNARLL